MEACLFNGKLFKTEDEAREYLHTMADNAILIDETGRDNIN